MEGVLKLDKDFSWMGGCLIFSSLEDAIKDKAEAPCFPAWLKWMAWGKCNVDAPQLSSIPPLCEL